MSPNDKPRGYFQKLLAIDCETTGLCFGSDSPVTNNIPINKGGEQHQTVSWGVIVADALTFEPIEDLYVEIKWNKVSKQQRKANDNFGREAEQIHRLTFEHLEDNAMSEQEAVVSIGELIMKHWGPTVCVHILGHNGHLFDLPFLRDLFRRQGVELKFGSRHLDSSSLGFGTVGAFNSDDLFEIMGLSERDSHNALEDAHMSLEVFRRIRMLWKSSTGISYF